MKKNILFVMPSLAAGGGEKSLINLLSQINFEDYNVDLFLFSHNGIFIESLPKEVNLINHSKKTKIFTKNLLNSSVGYLLGGKVHLAYSRFMFSVKHRLIDNHQTSEQQTWKYYSRAFDKLEKEYDVAIGYLEKSPIYFIIDKVKAKKKIGWIHTNYTSSGMDALIDEPYLAKLDHIVTVSEECATALIKHFNHLKEKIKVIYNIVSPEVINLLSNDQFDGDEFLKDPNAIYIGTIARLSHEKGIDLAIKACQKLVISGFDIKWFVIGEGQERNNLEELIQNLKLQDHFKLLGLKENPYPFLKKCDIYVQPSRYEGKSIAIDEAKILSKPIILTNFETAKDHLEHEFEGVIVDLSEDGIAKGIAKLINDKNYREQLEKNLSSLKLGTENEIYKLYDLF